MTALLSLMTPIRWSLSKYLIEKDADLFIGGVKERPIAYKLGVGFCDHNHERKTPLAGSRRHAQLCKRSSYHSHQSGMEINTAKGTVNINISPGGSHEFFSI
jgi:hypothetical protein